MKNINPDHLSCIASMLYGNVHAYSEQNRIVKAVEVAKQLIEQSQTVADLHNKILERGGFSDETTKA